MTTAYLNMMCPNCDNPLMLTFSIASTTQELERELRCSRCGSRFSIKLGISPK